MNKEENNKEENNTVYDVSMKTLNISSDYFKIIMRMVFVEVMKILNYFLEMVRDEIQAFAPNVEELSNIQNQNMTLLKTIEMISESPEFQERWKEFAENIASLLKILLEKIKLSTENEFSIILDQLTDLVQKNVKNSVFGAASGALEGVCALPPAAPICMMASVASTTSKVGGQTIITMLNSISKMAEAFSQIFGDTALPFAETIKKTRDFFDYIDNMKQKVNSNIENVTNKASNVISNIDNMKQTINSNIQS
jgi:prefoldin subunit 5